MFSRLNYLYLKYLAVPSIRQKQVGELVRRNFGIQLLEQGRLIYGDALVTVTDVKMSPDLSLAKIYLSIYNTDNAQAVLLEMQEQINPLRQGLAHRLRKHVRKAPDIALFFDDTLDEMAKVDRLFEKLKQENQLGTLHEEE
jgi:ribosome-binding factor A